MLWCSAASHAYTVCHHYTVLSLLSFLGITHLHTLSLPPNILPSLPTQHPPLPTHPTSSPPYPPNILPSLPTQHPPLPTHPTSSPPYPPNILPSLPTQHPPLPTHPTSSPPYPPNILPSLPTQHPPLPTHPTSSPPYPPNVLPSLPTQRPPLPTHPTSSPPYPPNVLPSLPTQRPPLLPTQRPPLPTHPTSSPPYPPYPPSSIILQIVEREMKSKQAEYLSFMKGETEGPEDLASSTPLPKGTSLTPNKCVKFVDENTLQRVRRKQEIKSLVAKPHQEGARGETTSSPPLTRDPTGSMATSPHASATLDSPTSSLAGAETWQYQLSLLWKGIGTTLGQWRQRLELVQDIWKAFESRKEAMVTFMCGAEGTMKTLLPSLNCAKDFEGLDAVISQYKVTLHMDMHIVM